VQPGPSLLCTTTPGCLYQATRRRQTMLSACLSAIAARARQVQCHVWLGLDNEIIFFRAWRARPSETGTAASISTPHQVSLSGIHGGHRELGTLAQATGEAMSHSRQKATAAPHTRHPQVGSTLHTVTTPSTWSILRASSGSGAG
jgi:hypothetical protein